MAQQVSITCEEFVDLAAGKALHAIDPSEVEQVEQHATTCPECDLKLRQFRETAAALGVRVPQVDPPAALRGRLLDAVRQTPQERTPDLMPRRAPRRPRFSPAWLVAAASFVISL